MDGRTNKFKNLTDL